jgi:murein DD-endopeptidase MepM/ murein hydrolase activator NlpD
VSAGQVVGYEGNTGNSTGCHLHWMVELNGNFVNPRLFV